MITTAENRATVTRLKLKKDLWSFFVSSCSDVFDMDFNADLIATSFFSFIERVFFAVPVDLWVSFFLAEISSGCLLGFWVELSDFFRGFAVGFSVDLSLKRRSRFMRAASA